VFFPVWARSSSALKPETKRRSRSPSPADFAPVSALAGKVASYAIEILEIRERVLPELNEEFFKSQQVDNLEALKPACATISKCAKTTRTESAQRRQVTEAIGGESRFPDPQSLVESETQSVLRQFIEENTPPRCAAGSV